MPTQLEARGIDVTLGGAAILREVDLDVVAGETVALVGPNGAGKSTLLGVLSGDIEPEAGTVLLDGWPIGSRGARELARRRSVLLQQQRLAFGFRVAEVVRMGRAPWHRTVQADRDDEVVESSMRRCDIVELGERLYPTLSGGEQARTGFARVLAQETSVLLLDEPTASLDIRHQEALLDIARQTADAGAAVVVVLHDLSLAAAYADRICVLSRGRVVADGLPLDVLTSALLTEVYEYPVEVSRVAGSLVVVPRRTRSRGRNSIEEVACLP